MLRRTWWIAALVLALCAPAAAQKRPKKPPVDRDAALLAKLDKELIDQQVRGAMYPALRTARRIHSIKEKKLGRDHPEVTRALSTVASLTSGTGDFVGALAIHRELLARAEKLYGAGHAGTLTALEGLASQYWVAQRFEEADKLYQRIIALKKKEYGADSTMYAMALQMYAGLLWGRGAYTTAERYYLESKAIYDKTAGPDDPQQSGILMNLGWLYWSQGQHTRARTYFERSFEQLEKVYAKLGDKSYSATMLLSIASIYATGGREDWARPLEARGEKLVHEAIATIEQQHGASDSRLISPLSSLMGLQQRRKKYDEAERTLRRLIAISEAQAAAQQQGAHKVPHNPLSQVGWLTQLAYLERQRGQARQALPLLNKVRAIYQRTYGGYMASTIDQQIADVYRELGQHARARRMLEKLVRQSKRTWGPRHPMVSFQLESLAVLHLAEGKAKPALGRLRESLAIQEPNLALVLATGTESDHATYFQRIAHQLHLAITLNTRHAPKDGAAARVAMETILRRKGRILDAAASSVAALRGHLSADDQKLLDELAAARARLSKLIIAGPSATGTPEEYTAELGRLEREVKRLEDQVRRKSGTYRVQTQPIELKAVQAAIPADAVLVEIVRFQPYDAKSWGMTAAKPAPRRYVAYLLRRTGDPTWIDLGEADPIDKAADAFLAALADPDRRDVDKLGRALFDRGIAPVVQALGKTRQVLVAPDGLLNLVPLGAVVDQSGRHLVRRFTFTYLTSGRDLLRLATGAAPKQGPVIVADPVFDAPKTKPPAGKAGKAARRTAAAPATRGRRSRDLRGKKWARLPGTAQEAEALAKMLGEVRLLRGARATEAALKKVSGPRILHVATHGFFLPAEPEPPPPTSDVGQGGPPLNIFAAQQVMAQAGPENPLLRSGLALAGANALSSGEEDGVLTALEAAGLDLWGTQLVVLSACETGVGKVTEGDGVHGLRRALVIAGAETLVMSLWQVDDMATRELMTGYYQRIEEGQGRSEALRQVQLKMLRADRTSHPYYWASFVPTGNWAPVARPASGQSAR